MKRKLLVLLVSILLLSSCGKIDISFIPLDSSSTTSSTTTSSISSSSTSPSTSSTSTPSSSSSSTSTPSSSSSTSTPTSSSSSSTPSSSSSTSTPSSSSSSSTPSSSSSTEPSSSTSTSSSSSTSTSSSSSSSTSSSSTSPSSTSSDIQPDPGVQYPEFCDIHVEYADSSTANERYLFGETFTISAKSNDFCYWTVDRKIVSYDNLYSFPVYQDTVIKEVAGKAFIEKPLVNLLKDTRYGNTDYLVQYHLPEDFDFVEIGVIVGGTSLEDTIVSTDTQVDDDDIAVASAYLVKSEIEPTTSTLSLDSGESSLISTPYLKYIDNNDDEGCCYYQIDSNILIYEVYGAGGNNGSLYRNDYVILYNTGEEDESVDGYSLQYASKNGDFNVSNLFPLIGTIKAHEYYFVRLASNSTIHSEEILYIPKITGSTNIAASDGKIALSSNCDVVKGNDDLSVIDFVGYGTANKFEGTAAPAPSTTSSIQRVNPQIDTNDNGVDFELNTPLINLLDFEASEITSVSLPNTVELNGTFNYTNQTVNVSCCGLIKPVPLTSEMVTGFDSSSLGIQHMTVQYNSLSYDYSYTVVDPTDTSFITVHFIDLTGGPGDCVLIDLGDIEILIDAGEKDSTSTEKVREALNAYTDGTIEYVIATHPDSDHIGGMPSVFENFIVETLFKYQTSTTSNTAAMRNFNTAIDNEPGLTVNYIYDWLDGQTSRILTLSDDVYLEFYDTGFLKTENKNHSSIVCVLNAYGTRILFNGDAEENQEKIYAPLVNDVDIFCMGHHGSRNATTSYLLSNITPEICIAQVGDCLGNSYKHPTYEAMARVYSYNVNTKIYSGAGGNWDHDDDQSERNGELIFTINNTGYVLTCSGFGDYPLEMRYTSYWQNSDKNTNYHDLFIID